MEYNLMCSIFRDIVEANGKEPDGIIPPSTEEMREQMRDPENLLEFLALFGKATGLKDGFESTCNSNGRDKCGKCEKIVGGFGSFRCMRFDIGEIVEKYTKEHAQKYRIVKVTSDDRCIKHTCTLPGEFEKQQAEDIVKAYNSKEYKIEAV